MAFALGANDAANSMASAVGAISGTAFATGEGSPRLDLLVKIFPSWLLTVPAAGILSTAIYAMLASVLLYEQ